MTVFSREIFYASVVFHLYTLLTVATTPPQSEEHFKRHPWGKVPAITFPEQPEEDGKLTTLYESRAICKYLARKYAFPLLPSAADASIEAAALFDQAESVEMQYFAEPAGRIAFEKFAKKFMGLPADEAVVAMALKAVEQYFDVADRLLQHNDGGYMAGRDFSLVDIFYIPLIQRLFACGYGDVVLHRKAVRSWWERCTNRPAIQKLLAADKETAAAAMAAAAAARK